MPHGLKAPTGMLPSTPAFKREFARLNHFIWPAAGALWNLRWQVQGYLQSRPDASPKEMSSRFLLGSGLQERVDFKRSCLIDSWDDQQELLAEMALLALFSLYEGWLQEGQQSLLRDRDSCLEWPSKAVGLRVSKNGVPLDGIGEGLAAMNAGTSTLMASAFEAQMRKSQHFMPAGLDNLMIAYRYWKEVRNAIVHRGRKVTDPLVAAQTLYATVPASTIGLTALVMLDADDEKGGRRPLIPGDSLGVSLYATFNLAHIINKLVVTLDYLLASSPAGEQDFLRRLSEQIRWNDPGNRKVRYLRSTLRRMSHPETATMEALLSDVASALK